MTGKNDGQVTTESLTIRGLAYREADRLAALDATGILDTEPEAEFDTIVTLAARLFSAPKAAMTLVDDHRQWFKSKIGLDRAETPLSESICAIAVGQNAPLLIPDALHDPRVADRDDVRSGEIRSYAGVPISGRDGLPLGTLCVFDTKPREFEAAHVEMLSSLSQLIGDELDLRRHDAAAGIDSITARHDVANLRRAVDNDQLVVFYQPVVDLASGAVASVEALVRWNHPERGLLSPDAFLPLAEVSGVTHAIDRWVFATATRTIAELRSWRPGLTKLGVAVNVQLPATHDTSWATEITDSLRMTGLPPEALTLEVTERSLDVASGASVMALQSLVDLGCRVAIDDIGTGTSSLARLAEMPASAVKIDRSFVHHMLHDRRRAAVVSAVAGLGRELGLDVVAEGVENEDVALAVARAGCTAGQGYYWARPMGEKTLFDYFMDR